MTGVRAPRLRELARAPVPPGRDVPDSCDLCAEPVPERHRHLRDVSGDDVLCACRSCVLLFDREAAGGRHYRLLPERRRRLESFTVDDALWASLGVPVGLAFFVRERGSGGAWVGYPSPLGATRSDLSPQVWEVLAGDRPELADLAEDVEALLVRRTADAAEYWIVPLDDCYRLVALVRAHWRGLGGGQEVHGRVGEFFTGLSTAAAGGLTRSCDV